METRTTTAATASTPMQAAILARVATRTPRRSRRAGDRPLRAELRATTVSPARRALGGYRLRRPSGSAHSGEWIDGCAGNLSGLPRRARPKHDRRHIVARAGPLPRPHERRGDPPAVRRREPPVVDSELELTCL